jgi:hypothetical protein
MGSVIIRDGVPYISTSIVVTQELRDESKRQKKEFTELVETTCRNALGMKPLEFPARSEGR